ncbi:MAG: hypothetical protein IJ192_05325 [Clostridia bacterium]|nr:hypothetical protein [Clostridia bacterium]
MKKIIVTILSCFLISGMLVGCSDNTEAKEEITVQNPSDEESIVLTESENEISEDVSEEKPESSKKNGEPDLDLTELSSTMVYSEVYNIVTNPDDYRGKTIKMSGYCSSYVSSLTNQTIYSCVIPDATACCAQGIEFRLAEGYDYPEGYDEITIIGTFDTYEEEPFQFAVLKDAKFV